MEGVKGDFIPLFAVEIHWEIPLMAYYEHLPIYKKAMDMAVYFEKLVKNFSRYNKYNLGAEMRSNEKRRTKMAGIEIFKDSSASFHFYNDRKFYPCGPIFAKFQMQPFLYEPSV